MSSVPGPSLPAQGRLAGIDYGTVRIGVALCDDNRILASPWETYTRQDIDTDRVYFQELVTQQGVVGFVVGLPVHNSGEESQKSNEARDFAAWLIKVTERPVAFVDERFTSAQARQLLGDAQFTKKQRKARIDKLAAQIILSTYLEAPQLSQTPRALDD